MQPRSHLPDFTNDSVYVQLQKIECYFDRTEVQTMFLSGRSGYLQFPQAKHLRYSNSASR
ncbi:hypothetical protein DICVIV_03696 [Dictyocaulus viviparus]|uniref:Uncharacterized protein n=1 Tax=Dictyocaulus viviparus TaxID=29172 RepID=A0A0D8XZN5_DICVI|nr:hypothetical protein DICVIV_03696 [Dictyocaulus viviparus]